MHSNIARFPSDHFYQGRLHTGHITRPLFYDGMTQDQHRITVVDVGGEEESDRKGSYFRSTEVRSIVDYLACLFDKSRKLEAGNVCVLTPYKGQVRKLCINLRTRR